MKTGQGFEREFSRIGHSKHIPFLISSALLRSQNLGQIDVAILKMVKGNKRIILYECKLRQFPSKSQWARLIKTQDYLSRVLDIETKLELKFCQKDDRSLFF